MSLIFKLNISSILNGSKTILISWSLNYHWLQSSQYLDKIIQKLSQLKMETTCLKEINCLVFITQRPWVSGGTRVVNRIIILPSSGTEGLSMDQSSNSNITKDICEDVNHKSVLK